ncbi:interferon phi 1 [Diretmus argenteus]
MHNWIGVVFLICSFTSSVLCCDWLRHYGHHSNNSLVLLDQMVESRLVFIRDSLELIGGLYLHGNLSSVTWDTTKIEHFLLSIYRQTDGLNSCGSSTASWELIRKETKFHLQQLDLLVATIRSSSHHQ